MHKTIIRSFIYIGLTVVTSVVAKDLPNGFVDLKTYIPTIKLDIRYYTSDNFVGKRIDGYENPRALLTKQAAESLKNVQNELVIFGLSLKVYDAYRPQRAVDHFVRWAKDLKDTKMKLKYYPRVEKENLFSEGYIFNKSGHSRGSTIDVTIVSLDDAESAELDMGTNWDFFSPSSWPQSPLVTVQQRANRALLYYVMRKHGFMVLNKEWWHFTLENEPYPNRYFDFPIK